MATPTAPCSSDQLVYLGEGVALWLFLKTPRSYIEGLNALTGQACRAEAQNSRSFYSGAKL